MNHYIRLARFPNLLIIVLTQLLVWFCLIKPSLAQYNNLPPFLSGFNFFLVVLSTVLIAAAGYVINDYEDLDIDRVNKPDRLIITKAITKDAAWRFYLGLNFTGIAIGAYPAYYFQSFNLFFIQALCSGALWFYSTSFKKQLLIGNIIVSVLAGMVVLLPAIYELAAEARQMPEYVFNLSLVSAYAFFAFITTMIREIVKDAEDIEGDELNECATLPIVWGIGVAKAISIVFCLFTIAAVAFVQYNRWIFQDYITFSYFIIAVQLPLFWLIWLISKADGKEQFQKASTVTKLVMLGGILSMIPFSIAIQ